MSIFKKKTIFDKFWKWFLDNEEFILNNLETNTDEVVSKLTENLREIHPNIAFEIPFVIVNGKRDFIISADGVYDLFDEVVGVCDAAPILENWNVIPFRPRTNQENQSIELDGITIDYTDIYFQYELTDLPIDLEIYINNFDGADNRYVHAYFILLDTLVGEFDAVTIIGETTVHPLTDRDINELLPFTKLRDLIDELSVEN